jgi:hypothetical protein
MTNFSHLTRLEFAREFCQSGTNVQALGEIQFEEFSKCLYQESRIKNQDEFNDYHRRHFDGKQSSIFVPTKRPNKIVDPFLTE